VNLSLIVVQRIQGLVALAGLIALSCFLAWMALDPMLETRQAIVDAKARIERFKSSVDATGVVQDIETSMVISTGVTAEAKSLSVQRLLVDGVRGAGLSMRQLSASPPESMERGLRRLSYKLDAGGDLENWTTFLKQLGEARPAVFVDRVALRSGPGVRADLNLSIELDVSAYILEQESPQ